MSNFPQRTDLEKLAEERFGSLSASEIKFLFAAPTRPSLQPILHPSLMFFLSESSESPARNIVFP